MEELELLPRVKTIANLQNQFFHHDAEELQRLNGVESSQLPIVPTIGAEVEVTWSSMFPKQAERWFADGKTWDDFSKDEIEEFDVLCSALDEEVLPTFYAVQRAGVPKGKDSYWEFANQPTRSYQTLAREIGMLMSSNVGVIPVNNNLPMHITLGNITYESGVFYVLSAAEITGGTTGNRIRSATINRHVLDRNWARKGPSGLYVRAPGELVNANDGCEMRTFVADSPEQVKETLRTTQLLGTALNGFREYKAGSKTEVNQRLWLSWKRLVQATKTTFLEAGLEDVNKKWMPPYDRTKPWKELADFIDEVSDESIKNSYSNVVRHIVYDIELDLLSAGK